MSFARGIGNNGRRKLKCFEECGLDGMKDTFA